MNTNTMAAAIVGFLLGGLTVSVAAELENDDPQPPAHSAPAQSAPVGTVSGAGSPAAP